ncbi:helix-turn-helix transcriptional regulator [Oscillibacter sp. MSJ-2]|uniref:Helix-turn-helix transcriptional regulator n=1 Tax=Dysosmobacter acutus TaxID=2841504 RepID=A0ABS6FCY4_9FIRM|nr:helix-turn-helix transcriptional regulator [Dysosmobacter acutus]MBU5627506.1 helix-turn-helix transcriptional regulator [Dysosmobacter acutus]
MLTFDPLWETMKRKKISQYALIKKYGVSTGTLDALRKNHSITLNTLNDLCNILQCDVSDIIQFTPDEKE